jgi:uncharacterized phage infection (PIP) family protein YhgE
MFIVKRKKNIFRISKKKNKKKELNKYNYFYIILILSYLYIVVQDLIMVSAKDVLMITHYTKEIPV